jgi:hypothetical protein
LPDGDWEAMIDPYDSNNFGDKKWQPSEK